ncbi:hypothetical protein J6590_042092 [Homalodisca vitripennis]|nr:hypothetical protein J6590_042092 [Homalodisca vitripennis]
MSNTCCLCLPPSSSSVHLQFPYSTCRRSAFTNFSKSLRHSELLDTGQLQIRITYQDGNYDESTGRRSRLAVKSRVSLRDLLRANKSLATRTCFVLSQQIISLWNSLSCLTFPHFVKSKSLYLPWRCDGLFTVHGGEGGGEQWTVWAKWCLYRGLITRLSLPGDGGVEGGERQSPTQWCDQGRPARVRSNRPAAASASTASQHIHCADWLMFVGRVTVTLPLPYFLTWSLSPVRISRNSCARY